MKIKEIEELINFINQSGLEEVNLETEHIKLTIKRSKPHGSKEAIGEFFTTAALSSTAVSLPTTPFTSPGPIISEPMRTDYVTIKSPMIGTFYRATNPESAPFVQQGQAISQDQTVCIIEAMKLFNEIEAEVSGTVVKVLVEDASPVEYDQPLFLIKPA